MSNGVKLINVRGLGMVPARMVPQMGPQVAPGIVPASLAYQQQLGLAETKALPSEGMESDPAFATFEKIPAFYVCTVQLGGAANDTQPGSVQLRPEPFILKRLTWCTTGDVYPSVDTDPGYSVQGRAVTMKWGDEFTQLFGNQECLLSAAFGDSNGFLDIPRGVLFQGKQTLNMKLTRLFWPSDTTPGTTRFDFNFQGIALLPKGVHQSGSAG